MMQLALTTVPAICARAFGKYCLHCWPKIYINIDQIKAQERSRQEKSKYCQTDDSFRPEIPGYKGIAHRNMARSALVLLNILILSFSAQLQKDEIGS
jgi:hypothetical protein